MNPILSYSNRLPLASSHHLMARGEVCLSSYQVEIKLLRDENLQLFHSPSYHFLFYLNIDFVASDFLRNSIKGAYQMRYRQSSFFEAPVSQNTWFRLGILNVHRLIKMQLRISSAMLNICTIRVLFTLQAGAWQVVFKLDGVASMKD